MQLSTIKSILWGLLFMAVVAAGCNKGETPSGPSNDNTVVNSNSDGDNDNSGDNSDSDDDSNDNSGDNNDSDDDSDSDSESDGDSGNDEESDNDSDSDNDDDSDNDSDSDTDTGDNSDDGSDDNNNNSDDDTDTDNNNNGDTGTEVKVIEYPFTDLAVNCAWDVSTFPNPYGIMSFDEQPRWSVCSGNGVYRMSPPVINPMDTRYYRPDVPHTTVVYLDEPALEVSLHTANHRAHRSTGEYYTGLTAYDSQGNEIDTDENIYSYLANSGKATRITVNGTIDNKIHSFGLSSYQNATYFDNIRFKIPVREEDLTPPEIFFTVEHEELWPPDRRMVLAVSGIQASDDSGDPVSLDVGVESNEPVDGLGAGDTSPDWEISETGDGTVDVYLRAERSGTGNGRVYTVTIRAEDAAGNVTEKEAEVGVPNDQWDGDSDGGDSQDSADSNAGNNGSGDSNAGNSNSSDSGNTNDNSGSGETGSNTGDDNDNDDADENESDDDAADDQSGNGNANGNSNGNSNGGNGNGSDNSDGSDGNGGNGSSNGNSGDKGNKNGQEEG